MGRLTYDSTTTIDFDDRVLAHLQIAIGVKLRRGEGFTFSWKDDPDGLGTANSLWLAPNIPLHFKYYGARVPTINKDWVLALAAASNSGSGLHLVREPVESHQEPNEADREQV